MLLLLWIEFFSVQCLKHRRRLCVRFFRYFSSCRLNSTPLLRRLIASLTYISHLHLSKESRPPAPLLFSQRATGMMWCEFMMKIWCCSNKRDEMRWRLTIWKKAKSGEVNRRERNEWDEEVGIWIANGKFFISSHSMVESRQESEREWGRSLFT